MNLKISQDVLNRRVFNSRVYDLHVKEFMLGQTKKYLSKEKVTIDVGAATGIYSHFFAQHSAYVFSYEAVPVIYNQLYKLESIHNNIITMPKAVSNFEGMTDFYVDDKRLSNNSFTNLVNGQKIKVETILLDNEDLGIIGFIKIDVEGHEFEVLEGAKKIIDLYKPTCMVEIYPKFNKGPIEKTFNFFFERHYKCFYNHKGKGLITVENIKDGIEIAKDEKMIKLHDGDFLFSVK